jgi:hypothetical protein
MRWIQVTIRNNRKSKITTQSSLFLKRTSKKARESNQVLLFHDHSRTSEQQPPSTPPGTKPLGAMPTYGAESRLKKILRIGTLVWRKKTCRSSKLRGAKWPLWPMKAELCLQKLHDSPQELQIFQSPTSSRTHRGQIWQEPVNLELPRAYSSWMEGYLCDTSPTYP